MVALSGWVARWIDGLSGGWVDEFGMAGWMNIWCFRPHSVL